MIFQDVFNFRFVTSTLTKISWFDKVVIINLLEESESGLHAYDPHSCVEHILQCFFFFKRIAGFHRYRGMEQSYRDLLNLPHSIKI